MQQMFIHVCTEEWLEDAGRDKSMEMRDHDKNTVLRIKFDSESKLLPAWIQDPSSKIPSKLSFRESWIRKARAKFDSRIKCDSD